MSKRELLAIKRKALKKARRVLAAKGKAAKIESPFIEKYSAAMLKAANEPLGFDILPESEPNSRDMLRDYVRREVEAALKELLT